MGIRCDLLGMMEGKGVRGFLLKILKAGDFPSREGVVFNVSNAKWTSWPDSCTFLRVRFTV